MIALGFLRMMALKTLQKLGILRMIALRTMQKLGVLRMITLKTLQQLAFLCLENTARTGSFKDDRTGIFESYCTETLQILGVLRIIALKTLQKLGVLRLIALKTLQKLAFLGKTWKNNATFCCRVGERVHWMEVLQIATWDGRKNTYTISVTCFYVSVCAMSFASLRQSIFEKIFMMELREIRVIISRNNFWRINCIIISERRVVRSTFLPPKITWYIRWVQRCWKSKAL